MNLDKTKINAVILTGDLDFQRFPVASLIPTALWPVSNKKAIDNIITGLLGSGISNISFCCNKDIWQYFGDFEFADKIKVFQEELPLGTAGAFREAARDSDCELFIIMPASIISPPCFEKLINSHLESKSPFTVVFNPPTDSQQVLGESAGIYLANKDILTNIPEDGFYDIKETLIPELLRHDIKINTTVLDFPAGNFNNSNNYINTLLDNINNNPQNLGLNVIRHDDNSKILSDGSVKIAPTAQIYGTVVLLNGTSVSDNTKILGPAFIDKNVSIGSDNIISKSIIWSGSSIGSNCKISNSLITYEVNVKDNSILSKERLINPTRNKLTLNKLFSGTGLIFRLLSQKSCFFALGVVTLAAFIWAYSPELYGLWSIWQRSDEYSSGLLVPFIAIYILWLRRNEILDTPLKPAFWGLIAFIGSQVVRFFGMYYMYGSLFRLSIVLSFASIVLLVFGWQFAKKTLAILLFLLLMLPWPNRIQAAVSTPMQSWATSSAVFCLETTGYDVIREGNIISIGSTSVAVAEACNGLRMITAFFVIGAMVVLVVNRPLWQKALVFVSSVPIALVCNTIRLSVTAIAFTYLKGEYWEKVFHDFGGYAMMPLAIFLIICELWLLNRLTSNKRNIAPQVIAVRK
jgi:exosortase